MEIIIVGNGEFGSALASVYLADGRPPQIVERNSPWPKISKPSAILLCVPTQKIPQFVEERMSDLLSTQYIISTAKGIIRNANKTPLQYLSKFFKKGPTLLCLSGPSFAAELKAGHPAALVLASKTKGAVDKLSPVLSTKRLRIYKSDDPLGVELCGALKNIYALAAGMSDGLGFGSNSQAFLTTRALAEMMIIGKKLGAKPLTFSGLAGVGDLFLTCSSNQSRNFRFGQGLAQGKTQEALLEELGTVEGLWTASVAKKLLSGKKAQTPLLDMVAAILEKKIQPEDALKKLMAREVRREF